MTTESDFIVLGSGASSSTPLLRCITRDRGMRCACIESMKSDPSENKNYRLNPSILLRFRSEKGTKYILVDACKSFREAAVRWFPKYGVPHVNAVLFTHEHSDAILGIDDLREAQAWNARLPMYMSERAYVHVKETFDYLFNSDPEYLPGVPKSIPVAKNRLAAASFTAVVKTVIIAQPELKEAESPRAFDIQGVRVVSFPVIHGANNLSLGFVFGRSESKFVYISDIIELPRASEDYLKSLKIEILMVDAIHRTDDMDYAHQSVMSAIKMGLRLRAEKVFLTGMGHTIVYEDLSAELPEMVRMAKAAAKSQQDIQVVASHDGMVVSLKGIDL